MIAAHHPDEDLELELERTEHTERMEPAGPPRWTQERIGDEAYDAIHRSRERRTDARLERQAKVSALLFLAFIAFIVALLIGAWALGA